MIDRVDGANAPELSKKVQHHATSFVAPVTIDAHSNNDSTEVSTMSLLSVFCGLRVSRSENQ